MYGVRNAEVFEAMDLFEKLEGVDIVPAAGVAVAALMKAVKNGSIDKGSMVLLNITGGGERNLKMERETKRVDPVFVSKDITGEEIGDLICKVLKPD